MTYTTTTAGAALGLSSRTLRWYHKRWGYGYKLEGGRDLNFTDDDLAEIAEHQARGPGRPSRQ